MRKTIPLPDKQWTVIDIVRWGTEFFAAKNVDSPRLTIEMMVCAVLNIGRLKLYTDFERPLSLEELADLRLMVRRRTTGEPLQYILGYTDFYSVRIEVTPDVLIPRPETEFIVERVIRMIGSQVGPFRCLDVGTGSGCIPVAIAKRCHQTVWTALDKEPKALKIAENNINLHELAYRISTMHFDFLTETLGSKYNIITMNPPYIPQHDLVDLQHEVRDYEPHSALTDDGDGLQFYRRMSEVLPDILEKNGILLMEIGFGQFESVKGMFAAVSYNVELVTDLQDIPRVVVVTHKN
ncbi:MAG: peptide chain release factor N(5)-glutamine methyltransferase [Ignavibacteria bacterium]|nr:peptide chain release factor N(5)-glutamine methyltransferase [Ignavibacteria bacterium]